MYKLVVDCYDATATTQPSSQPRGQPTAHPSSHPSVPPTRQPSAQPFAAPSSQPSSQPTETFLRLIKKIRASPIYQAKNGFAFAATTAAGTVVTWGEGPHGGDSSAVQSKLTDHVTQVVPAQYAYAALKDGGSVVPWGLPDSVRIADAYGPGSIVLSELVANEAAFAGIDAHTGGVVAAPTAMTHCRTPTATGPPNRLLLTSPPSPPSTPTALCTHGAISVLAEPYLLPQPSNRSCTM